MGKNGRSAAGDPQSLRRGHFRTDRGRAHSGRAGDSGCSLLGNNDRKLDALLERVEDIPLPAEFIKISQGGGDFGNFGSPRIQAGMTVYSLLDSEAGCNAAESFYLAQGAEVWDPNEGGPIDNDRITGCSWSVFHEDWSFSLWIAGPPPASLVPDVFPADAVSHGSYTVGG